LKVGNNAKPHVIVRAKSEQSQKLIREESTFIETLGKTGKFEVIAQEAEDPSKCVKTHLSDDIQIFINIIGLVDIKLEMERILKRQGQLDKFIEGQKKKMNIKDYETKVKEEIRKEQKEKLDSYEQEKAENEKSMAELKSFQQ
jgi:valyl-tRNA synthetase